MDNEFLDRQRSNICCIYHPPEEECVETCSSDSNNELERSEQSKREHLKKCSKKCCSNESSK